MGDNTLQTRPFGGFIQVLADGGCSGHVHAGFPKELGGGGAEKLEGGWVAPVI